MIRSATEADISTILEIINDAAQRYRGVIPQDLYREPWMSEHALRAEMTSGVEFSVLELPSGLAAVMGVQCKGNVLLLRHSYVITAAQRQGFGSALLQNHLENFDSRPMLVGCLAAMTWAIAFYQQHGFQIVPADQILPLRKRYWDLADAHIRRGVVLANPAWFERENHATETALPDRPAAPIDPKSRAELAIQYVQVLYQQITDHKEIRDRWFRYYLLVISVPFGLLAAGLQSDAWKAMVAYPNRMLWVFSLLLLSLGALFFMLYIRQRINYLAIYERALKFEREIIQPQIDGSDPSREPPQFGQFSADFFANGVHILLNSVWSVLAWTFGGLALQEHDIEVWLWTGGFWTFVLSACLHIAVRDRALHPVHRTLKV